MRKALRCLGFCNEGLSDPGAVPGIVEIAGWRWAFPLFALGPAFGIVAIQRFRAAVSAASKAKAGVSKGGRSQPLEG
jgi:hypothetical protein